jgi:hypothetical protein
MPHLVLSHEKMMSSTVIDSPDGLGVDRVGERCESYLVPVYAPLVLLMELALRQRRAVQSGRRW